MLCVSIAPKQAVFAKVDLLNASRQTDMVELGLDKIQGAIDVKELISGFSKPLIISCRRVQEGGSYQGTEADRLALLRQAAAAGPTSLELDTDAARHIARIGSVKRIISFTSLDVPLKELPQKIQEAAALGGDFVKFSWPTPTLDSAWPLLALLTRPTVLPVVGLSQGAAGRTASLLGCKYGSPWIYGALEQGMETYPGQATREELESCYDWRGITKETRFHGVVGFGQARLATIRLLNAACKDKQLDARFVPLEIGDFGKLRSMLDLLRFGGVIGESRFAPLLIPLADQGDKNIQATGYGDVYVRQEQGWKSFGLSAWVARKALCAMLRRLFDPHATLKGRWVLVIGTGPLLRSLIHELKEDGASVLLSSGGPGADEVQFCEECGHELAPKPDPSVELAQKHKASFIPFEKISQSRPEILIVANPTLQLGHGPQDLNPAWLRPPLIVVDLTRISEESELISEARQRGCVVIRPGLLFAELLAGWFQGTTNQELPRAIFREAMEGGV